MVVSMQSESTRYNHGKRPKRFCTRCEALGKSTMATMNFDHEPQNERDHYHGGRYGGRVGQQRYVGLAAGCQHGPDGEGTEGNGRGARVCHGVSCSRLRERGDQQGRQASDDEHCSTYATRHPQTDRGDDVAGA
jgi:hypothetical protein